MDQHSDRERAYRLERRHDRQAVSVDPSTPEPRRDDRRQSAPDPRSLTSRQGIGTARGREASTT
jgi:hypothetical protein